MAGAPEDVFVSLGSNIAPEQNLSEAVALLREHCAVLTVSSAYQTVPYGFSEQPDFLNMAVKLHTEHNPACFKQEVLTWIEQQLGRVRDPLNKNAPRTIDLDISLWGSHQLSYGHKPWQVPDPDILRFIHVAAPLAELAPDLVYPGSHATLAEIADRLAAQSGSGAIRKLGLSGEA